MLKKYLPSDKIIPVGESDVNAEDADEELSEIEIKLSAIEGLDVDAAMQYAGNDEDILAQVVESIVSGSEKMIKALREDLDSSDYEAYRRDAHSVKGLMATIGLASLSDRAKTHELAAKEGNIDFIKKDCDGFLEEYRTVCEKLK